MNALVSAPRRWVSVVGALEVFRHYINTVWDRVAIALYREPLFRSQCISVGRNLSLRSLPIVIGQVGIRIGDDVRICGALVIGCAKTCDQPILSLGNNITIGDHVVIHSNREVIIEDGVVLGPNCFVTDSNEHPLDYGRRIAGEPCRLDELRSIRIRRGAVIGRRCTILRGVEIGECAIVLAGSTITATVPPNAIVGGNPAQQIGHVDVGAEPEEDHRGHD